MCACNNVLNNVVLPFSVFVIICCSVFVNCYNVDTVNFAKYSSPQESTMFGFTVALHQERGTNWVLVGAPEAQTSQYNVTKGGSVYRCPTTDDRCQEVPFDREGSTTMSGKLIDEKSRQWFGATLQSGGKDKPIVACAPRYMWFTHKTDRRDPVGTCYVVQSDFTAPSEYAPCRTNQWGYHRQGSCQAGFSAAISNTGKRLFVGAPGSWYWQGQAYSIDAYAQFPYSPGVFGTGAFGSGKVIQQSLENRPAVLSTGEGSEKDDDSYLGYSMAVGDFYDENEQGVAVGMPRGARLFGKVVLYSWNLNTHKNITGRQLGAYFGYAIASADVDGDGKDDLIIGAPMHTIPNNEGKYEMGRVYVIYQQSSKGHFHRVHTRDGSNTKARFGLSLCSLGDINLDGYGDFAVGAPYDGLNGRGAVYIYHGSIDGVREKHSQVIMAEEVGRAIGKSLETFGFSISGGMDLDGNDYPDMAIGSYLSDTAFFFRSRPVVKIEAYVRFAIANKQIVLDDKNCTLYNGQKVACTNMEFCAKYSGLGIPGRIELDLQYYLDVKKRKNPRMFFLLADGRNNTFNESMTLYQNQPIICRNKQVYIKNDIRDKLTTLDAEVRFAMRESQSFQQYGSRNPQAPLLPVLDLNLPPFRKDSLSIHKNCGDDSVCIPDLGLFVKPNVERYLLGSKEQLQFDVTVKNDGEDSFESVFDMILPSGVDFVKVIQYNKTEVRVLCAPLLNRAVRCDIGNPLPARKIAQFKILLKPYQREGMQPSFDFIMAVNSTNEELNSTREDNKKLLSIHIWVDSKLELGGTSRPTELYYYNLTSYKAEKIMRENDIGPPVTHVYSIRNNGPSDIKEAEMFFVWPYATMDGRDLLYLLEEHQTLGNIKCDTSFVNYKGYELNRPHKSIWETLKIHNKADFAGSSSSGILVEEGIQHKGVSSVEIEKKLKEQDSVNVGGDGDASFVHIERGRGSQTGGTSSGGGTVVHVGEDTGRGSKVHTVHTETSSWNSSSAGSGPVVTFFRNYSSHTGPDGKTVHTEYTSSGDGSSRGSGGSQFQGSHVSSSGGSDFRQAGSSSRGQSTGQSSWSSSGERVQPARPSYETHADRAKVVYTSSGGSESSYDSSRFGGAEVTMSSTYIPPLGYEEERRRGYHQEQSVSSTPTVVEGPYPGLKPTVATTGFVWNGHGPRPVDHQGQDHYSREEHGSRWNEQQGSQHAGSVESRYGGGHDSQRGGSYDSQRGGSYDTQRGGSYDSQHGGSHGSQHRGSSSSQSGGTYESYAGGAYEGSYDSQRGGSYDSHHGGSYGSQHRTSTGSQSGGSYESQHGGSYASQHRATSGSQSGGSHETHAGGAYDAQSGSQTGGSYGSQHRGSYGGGSAVHATSTQDRYGATDDDAEYDDDVEYEEEAKADTSQTAHGGFNRSFEVNFKINENDTALINHYINLAAAAAGQEGFRVGALDLGTGDSSNSIDTSRNVLEAHTVHYDPDLGRFVPQTSGAGGRASQHHEQNAGSYGGSQASGGSRYESRSSESSWSSHGAPEHRTYTHVERDNVHTDRPDANRGFHGRRRRQAGDLSDSDIEKLINCKSTKCFAMRCTVGPLLNDQEAFVALRFRVNVKTIQNITTSQPIELSSMMLSRISKLPYIGTPLDRTIHSHEIFTKIPALEPDVQPVIVQLWVVVLSAVAGAIILLLLIYLFYKCGFFKRNRPSDAPERQPLNRNGYHSGDEAL